jgi:hypothetical protein
LWKLRDEFVDDILEGRLPPNHPAVRYVLDRLERNVRSQRPIGLIDVFLIERMVLRREPKGYVERLAEPSMEGLTADQRALLTQHRSKCLTLVTASLLTSSWAGAAVVLWTLVRRKPGTAKNAVVQATKTPLGRRTAKAAKLVTSVSPSVSPSTSRSSNLVHA